MMHISIKPYDFILNKEIKKMNFQYLENDFIENKKYI